MKVFVVVAMVILVAPTTANTEKLTVSPQPLIRRKTTSVVRGLADRIDDIFGTERADENRRFSTLRISLRHTMVDGQPSETSYNVRLMLRPATFDNWRAQADRWLKRKKTRLRDSWRTAETQEPLSAAVAKDDDEDVSAETDGRDPWRPAFEQRFRLDRNNFYEGRLKLAKDVEWGPTLHHAVYDVRWSVQQRWESVLSAVSSYSLTDSLLLQFSNGFNWRISGSQFVSHHGPALSYAISHSKAISVASVAHHATMRLAQERCLKPSGWQ